MGAEIGARAISHLECISAEGIRAMANAKTIAVILPHTGYILRIQLPPVRQMIDAGIPIALGTDANPNAFSSAMVCFVGHLMRIGFYSFLFLVYINEFSLCSMSHEFRRSIDSSNNQ